jgi:hypothetical protein
MIQVYNSNLEAYNSKVKAYGVEADAYKSFIQAMLIEVEVYKAKLEGQKLVSDINDQAIKLFIALWEGEMSKIKLYESQLRASVVQIDYNKSIIERYSAQIQAYATKINALVAQYNADVNVYKADADIWVARSDRDLRGAEGTLKAEIAGVEKYLKDQQVTLDALKWGFELSYKKLQETAEMSAKIAAGALAGASASASLGYSEARPMVEGA